MSAIFSEQALLACGIATAYVLLRLGIDLAYWLLFRTPFLPFSRHAFAWVDAWCGAYSALNIAVMIARAS